MYTILQVSNISDELSIEIETRLRNIIPSHLAEEFFEDKERRRVKNIYTLSDKELWPDCQSEIIERLKVISPVLFYMKAHDVCMEIAPAIFLIEYQSYNAIEISCSSELIQILSMYGIQFELSVYAETFKSKELGEEIPEPIPPSPMNCILHVRKLGSENDFNQLIDKILFCRVDIPMNINESYAEGHNLTIMLSNALGWYDNHNKIMETLEVILPALAFASSLGASFEITVIFDMMEYRHRFLTCFCVADKFIQLLAKFNMKFTATIALE